MKISDILRHKGTSGPDGSAVVTITPTEPVSDLLARLAEHNVGALIVVDGERVAGIVSERDIVRRLASGGEAVLRATVTELMTTDIVHCTPDDSVDDVATQMTQRRVRHMPVLHDGALVGIVSIGDVVLARTRQLEQHREQLENYITQG